MKQILTITPLALCLLILAYIGQCTHNGTCPPESKDSTVIVRMVDTIKVAGKTVYKPKPYEVIKVDTVIIRDTVKFIQECSEIKKYILPVSDDTNSKVTVYATVQLNSIKDWTYKAEYYTRTTVIERNHVIIKQPVNKLLVGLILSGSSSKFGASPSFGLKTKKDNVMLFGYDVINRTYQAGYMLKIGK